MDELSAPPRSRKTIPQGVVVVEPFLLHCDVSYTGALIGAKGATIKQLQHDSGASISISDEDDIAAVLIKGDMQQIDTARTLLLDLVHSINWNRQAAPSAVNWFHKIKHSGGSKSLAQRVGAPVTKRKPTGTTV